MEGEVGKSRLAEYKAICKKVDAKAKQLTRKELNIITPRTRSACKGKCRKEGYW